MDRLEKKIFSDISDTFKLLKVNWNAIKKNPSCESDVNACVIAIDKFIEIIKEHQQKQKMYKDNFKNNKIAKGKQNKR